MSNNSDKINNNWLISTVIYTFVLIMKVKIRSAISHKELISYQGHPQPLNKRPMDHIAHLRKQFESINTYDYIRRKKPLLYFWELNGSSLDKIESHSPKDTLCQVWLKLAQWFWRGRFFNFVKVFSLIRNYLPLERGRTLHLNKIESASLKDALC